MSIHREPSKPSYGTAQYKSAGAAKAGITRTIKHYDMAKAQVAEAVANGEREFMAPYYNAFRDATDVELGRTHCADVDNYAVMGVEIRQGLRSKVTSQKITQRLFKRSVNLITKAMTVIRYSHHGN